MNRQRKRQLVRKVKAKKGLRKKHTKGAFGAKPLHLRKSKPQDVVVDNEK